MPQISSIAELSSERGSVYDVTVSEITTKTLFLVAEDCYGKYNEFVDRTTVIARPPAWASAIL